MTLSTFREQAVRWAVRTGLGPLLLYSMSDDPALRRSPLWPLLRGTYLTAQVLTGVQFDAMSGILDACADRVPTLTLLKGISIAEQYYPAPQLRPMHDLDVLVEESTIPAMEAILFELGYEQRSSRPREFYDTHHHRMPFVHPHSGVWIEVHRGLFPPNTRVGTARIFQGEHLASQLQPSTFQGRPVNRVSDPMQIVYIATHWAFAFKSPGGMIAMADLIYLLKNRKEAIPWEMMLQWVDGSVVAAYLYLMLTYLAKYQLVDIPSDVLRTLCLRQRSFGLANLNIMHALIDRYIVEGPPAGRLANAYHLETVWQTLLSAGTPLGNLLRVPWNLLTASRLWSGPSKFPGMLSVLLSARRLPLG